MLEETETIVHQRIEFLPLTTNANIHEGNALTMDWRAVLPPTDDVKIMGNPPFVGYSLQSKEQKADMLATYVDENGKPYKKAGKIDYVAAWYYKAAEYMQGHAIRAAFVSTNSITQGEQVADVWEPLYNRFGIHIDFAYRTFRWDSESTSKAHVHVVVIGFSSCEYNKDKLLFTDNTANIVKNINPYLIDASLLFVKSMKNAICDVPEMITGNRPADGGALIIEQGDYDKFVAEEPKAIPYIKKFIGSKEFINGIPRWCLWLVGVSPSEIRKMPLVAKRVAACRENRLGGAPDRQKLADTPTIFRETNNPDYFIVVPKVSSERRRYVPMGFHGNDVIASDLLFIIPNGSIYHFGVLESNVHMAWMRAVAGRLKSDYRYSRDVVYNTFPWPTPTDEQRTDIERTAQSILDARALYPESSLADLYDEVLMPKELREAHRANDRAVMRAYGFSTKMSESECVAELMKMYEELTRG